MTLDLLYIVGFAFWLLFILTSGKFYGLIDIVSAAIIAALWPAIVLTLFVISFVIIVGMTITGLNTGP